MNDLDKELDEILTAFYKKTLRVDGNTPEARAEAKAKIKQLIVQARIDELNQLLDKDNGCICQLADVNVCDHNWSLCNTIVERMAVLKKENKDE